MRTPDTDRAQAALIAIPALVEIIESGFTHSTHRTSEIRTKPGSKPPVPLNPVSDLDEAFITLRNTANAIAAYHHVTRPQQFWGTMSSFLSLHWPNSLTMEYAHRHAQNINHVFDTLAQWAIEEAREWRPLPGRLKCPKDALDEHNEPVTNQLGVVQLCNGLLLESATQHVIRCKDNKRHRWETNAEYTRLGLILGSTPQPVPLTIAATQAKVSPRTLQRWIEAGILPATKQGRTYLVDLRDIHALATRVPA